MTRPDAGAAARRLASADVSGGGGRWDRYAPAAGRAMPPGMRQPGRPVTRPSLP
jgi:hypothetical protein